MKHPNRGGPRPEGDNYLERYIAHQRPVGTEPVTLAVEHLNQLCDEVYGGEHRYTLNLLSRWRRYLRGEPSGAKPPQKVIDAIRAELIHVALVEDEGFASELCEYIGLPDPA